MPAIVRGHLREKRELQDCIAAMKKVRSAPSKGRGCQPLSLPHDSLPLQLLLRAGLTDADVDGEVRALVAQVRRPALTARACEASDPLLPLPASPPCRRRACARATRASRPCCSPPRRCTQSVPGVDTPPHASRLTAPDPLPSQCELEALQASQAELTAQVQELQQKWVRSGAANGQQGLS
jgi:hypothetical protein